MDILLLRFDAPLMSFGGVMVDQHGPTERFPGLSLLAGLFGNALGYRHGDADALEGLQARLEYAARWDVEPEALLDYHTADLGQPKMREPGWTTRGEPEHRAGGAAAAFGTHQRYRHYWANGVMTLAVALKEGQDEALRFPTQEPAGGAAKPPLPLGEGRGEGDIKNASPAGSWEPFGAGNALRSLPPGEGTENLNLANLATALLEPARPLFLGRKTCLPAAPLLLGQVQAPDVLAALRSVALAERAKHQPKAALEACWPAHLGGGERSRETAVYDRRDWRNQIHAGRRLRVEGLLELSA